jgi:hypothetical protein
VRLTTLAIVFLIFAIGLDGALSQAAKGCELVRERGSARLSQCGDYLKSWELKHSDDRWRVSGDLHNRQMFHCVLLGSRIPAGTSVFDILRSQGSGQDIPCPDEPSFALSFNATGEWKTSAQDGEAILEAFRRTPHYTVAQMHHGRPLDARTTCPVFRVTIAGVEGRATCLASDQTQSQAIAGVWMDGEFGFSLMLGGSGEEIETTKAKFLSFISNLKIIRASGDAALLRWF